MKRENSGKKGSYKKENQQKKMENIELKISVSKFHIIAKYVGGSNNHVRKKCIALNAYFRNLERSQINFLGSHMENLEKRKEQKEPKESRRREIKKRAEINKLKTREQ